MAEDCVDHVVERDAAMRKKAGPSKTLTTPLIGAGQTQAFPEGYHENLAVRLTQQFDLAYDVAQYLARNYGTRAPDVLKYVDETTVRGSRSGLYKHYPRLYEGAAATTGYPYLEAEVRYAVEREYAMKPCDILARRTRLAFLNSTAARLTLPKVVEIMADCLGWDEARQQAEIQNAEVLLAQDFAGPVPNKKGASLRTACTSDVKDIFDKLDPRKQGTLSEAGIRSASVQLGFPLDGAQLKDAMREMDANGDGKINFPEFLMWWNSSKESMELRDRMFLGRGQGEKWKTVQE
jgi:glycerol-3-phosphate dehydrogenase